MQMLEREPRHILGEVVEQVSKQMIEQILRQ